MKKVLIIGTNGSGKTTFARKLAEKTSLPLVHLDKLYWRDNWTHATNEEFDILLEEALKNDSWIIDGNISRTLPRRLECCDTVIYFDFPAAVCVFGALERSIKNYGKSRSDMGGYCPEKLNFRFLKSVLLFNKNNRKRFESMLAAAPEINLITLHSRKEAEMLLDKI